MTWGLLALILVVNVLALLAQQGRRTELQRTTRGLAAVEEARSSGSDKARLQHPWIDLSRCLGCATCIKACPEEGVLELVHGQAVVAHGARCVGHGRCADVCPVGAIALTLGDVSARRDLPAISSDLESTGVPNLFLAGEVTGYALIRTAIEHGRSVVDVVADRIAAGQTPASTDADVLDLCIVGAGPAGIAGSLQAKLRGLRFVTLEQELLGGTVARYPRKKLVMTQPVELPLHGRLSRTSYTKEELMELWESLVREHELPIRTSATLQDVKHLADGTFEVHTSAGVVRARSVCLALGRRGSPRKLGVPGEDSAKVAYDLIDAQSYTNRKLLVVGGGDSAVEAAVGLAEQPGNDVTLSYRKSSFSRLKAGNLHNLERLEAEGRLSVLRESEVEIIGQDRVRMLVQSEGETRRVDVPNDEVFVMAGGVPPFALLERSGISFDPDDRPAETPLAEQGSGLRDALAITLLLASMTFAMTLAFRGYYTLLPEQRPLADEHELLSPTSTLGLSLGVGATLLVLVNLSYLLRRSRWGERLPGSLKAWMTVHVGTGLLSVLLVLLHAGMAPRRTVGGHAFLSLAVLVVTGAVGRYLYAFVPRAANGKELALDEVRRRLSALSSEWDEAGRGFGSRVRDEIEEIVRERRWSGSLPARVVSLIAGQFRMRRLLRRMREEGREQGVTEATIRRLSVLARRAHKTALAASHFEDVRAVVASWRWIHRWVALLMILLVLLHVGAALRYGHLVGA